MKNGKLKYDIYIFKRFVWFKFTYFSDKIILFLCKWIKDLNKKIFPKNLILKYTFKRTFSEKYIIK